MGETRPVIRALDLRKAVPEWIALGCRVKIEPDGTVDVSPPSDSRGDDADLINWKRHR